MSEDTKKQLEQLIEKTKMYLGKKIVIKSYKQVSTGIIVVKTDSISYSFLPSEIEIFFKELKDVSESKNLPTTKGKNSAIAVNVYQPKIENKTLKESLMSVLSEINNDPSDEKYKKASSICAIANTMVNIQKAEIQIFNTMKK